MAGIYHPSRGGVRGGKDQFNWDDVKTDKDRESYLGHSVMVPTGKWQEGKDLIWYTRGKNNQEKTERERKKKEELQAVKDLERRAMEAALGKKSFSTGTTSLTAKELQEVLSRGKTEHGSEDRIHGVGHKRASNSKAEKYGTSFEGFDAGGRNNRSDSDREPDKKAKKKKKEKKKKKKKLKQQSDGSDDDEAFPRKRRYSSDDGNGKDRRRFLRDSSKRNSGEATKYVNSRRDDERSQYFDTRSHKSEYKDNRHDVKSDSRRNMNLDRRQDTHPNDEKYDRRRNAHADVKMSDRRRDAHADEEKSDGRRSSHPDDRRRNIKSDSRHNERHDEPMNKRQSRRSDSEEHQRNSRKRHSTGERKSNGRSFVKRSRRNSDSD